MRTFVLVVAALPLAACATLDGLSGGTSSAPEDAGVDAPAPPPPPEAGADAGDRYTAEVLADKPIAYYPLDETDGTIAHDRSGNGNDATVLSPITVGFAVPGAITTSANNRAMDLPNGSSLDLGNKFGFAGRVPFTVELWVKPRPGGGGYRGLFFKMEYKNNQPYQGTYFLFDPDGTYISLQRWIANPNPYSMCTPTSTTTKVAETAFSHVVAALDGQSAYIFVNGEQVASDAQNAAAVDGAVNASVGGGLDGVVDEVAIYDKALNAARIKAHYAAAR